jgi:hypothetical protein
MPREAYAFSLVEALEVVEVRIELTGEDVLYRLSESKKDLLIALGEGMLPLSCFCFGSLSSTFVAPVGSAGRGDLGGGCGGPQSRLPLVRSYMGRRRAEGGGLLSNQEVFSMSPTKGDGSGRSGDTARAVGIGGLEPLSNQFVGAFQEPALLLLESVARGGVEYGSNGASLFFFSSANPGVGGKGFGVARGSGGTVLINDQNDLAGRSIPSSDEDDLLVQKNGDDRKWLRASVPLFIVPCAIRNSSRAAAMWTKRAKHPVGAIL